MLQLIVLFKRRCNRRIAVLPRWRRQCHEGLPPWATLWWPKLTLPARASILWVRTQPLQFAAMTWVMARAPAAVGDIAMARGPVAMGDVVVGAGPTAEVAQA